MNKLKLLTVFVFFSAHIHAQQDFFAFKKNNKTIASFNKGSYFAFQAKDREWHTGIITRAANDSFFIKPMIIHYTMMGADTTYFPVQPYCFADVYAMPKKGVLIHYSDGRFQINWSAGHMHWYWIKSGWIFRIGGAGYVGLNVINSLLKKDPPFAGNNLKRLGTGAASFLVGELLHLSYKPVLPIGEKYHLQMIGTAK